MFTPLKACAISDGKLTAEEAKIRGWCKICKQGCFKKEKGGRQTAGPVKMIDGYSESLWKSVVVKSLRIGWPAGLEEASRRLSKSTMKSLLICSLFEDVFPPEEELKLAMDEVNRFDFEALCARETHHGQGLTDRFCDLEDEAVYAARNSMPDIWAAAKKYGIWLPPRSLNVFYTWHKLRSNIVGGKREIDPTPFTGIPKVMADSHTYEGKKMGQGITLLSGHYSQHREIGRLVQEKGWGWIREQVHGSGVLEVQGGNAQMSMFN